LGKTEDLRCASLRGMANERDAPEEIPEVVLDQCARFAREGIHDLERRNLGCVALLLPRRPRHGNEPLSPRGPLAHLTLARRLPDEYTDHECEQDDDPDQ
jgi:hypothetical protein